MTSITALFNQKHSLNVICVGYLTFNLIRSRPTAAPPYILKLLTKRALGPGEAVTAAATARAITVYSLIHTSVAYQGPNQTNQDSIEAWLKHEEPNSTRQQQEDINQTPSPLNTACNRTKNPAEKT